jgi:hypothetical protein
MSTLTSILIFSNQPQKDTIVTRKFDPALSLVPVHSAVPLTRMQGEDEEDTRLLRSTADQAIRYVRSYEWCLEIKESCFADGIGGVIGIFLFRVKVKGFDRDQWIWAFMGEIPSAYFAVGCYTNARAALVKYIEGLEEWAEAANKGLPLQNLIPIELSPNAENISRILQTSRSLRDTILPNIRGD